MNRRIHQKTFFTLLLFCLVPVLIHAEAVSVIVPENMPHNKLTAFYIDAFSREKRIPWFRGSLERSDIFIDFVNSVLLEMELPSELAYLPVLESGYNPRAVSRSGATGLWQLMRNSIAPYDIRITDWLDERRDFWKSTYGSLQKLQYNYTVLNDWLLAIAAYNCGLSRMKQAIEKAGTRDYWELSASGALPHETSQFIPKFFAIYHIATNRSLYGMPERAGGATEWRRIHLENAVNIKLLAEHSGVSLDILQLANAELLYDISPPDDQEYYLKVPAEYADAINRTLEEEKLNLTEFYVHRIQSGDTLYALSKHFGVSVDVIRQYNPGMQARYLQINTAVVIPAVKDVEPFSRSDAEPKPIPMNYHSGKTFTEFYTIKKGDTLWGIAASYGTSVEELTFANNLAYTELIRPGFVLKVPGHPDILQLRP